MIDEYFVWHKLKIYLNKKNSRVFFREREIWFTYLGKNVGYEQNGKGNCFLRPVIILKKFNEYIFWAVPLTRNPKNGKYYQAVKFGNRIQNTAILSQLRLLSSNRLKYRIGKMRYKDFTEIKQKIKQLLA